MAIINRVRVLTVGKGSNAEKAEIQISVEGRGEDHLLSLDSRIFTLANGTQINIRKAPFSVFTVELEGDNYFKTLRDKLFWGYDARNRQ